MDDAHDSPTSALALLVVDMQAPFLKAIPHAETLTRRVRFSIAVAQLLGIPIVFTEQVPDKLGPTLHDLRTVAPEAPVFGKTAFSALGADGVEAHLREIGVEHLLVVGIETPICVYQTAVQALGSGFDVTLLGDALGARRAEDARLAIAQLERTDCSIVPSETVFYSLLGDAAHPSFREFTALVKEHS